MKFWRILFPTFRKLNKFRWCLMLSILTLLGFAFNTWNSQVKFIAFKDEHVCNAPVWTLEEHFNIETVYIYDDQPTNHQYNFIEYLLNGNSRQSLSKEERKERDEKFKEIPVMFIPGSDETMFAHMYLAKALLKRSQENGFVFRFYSLDFKQEDAMANGFNMDNEMFFTTRAVNQMIKLHPWTKPVIIGSGYGGVIAQALVTLYKWELHGVVGANITDLVIMEGSNLQKPKVLIDSKMQKIYWRKMATWKYKREKVSTGMVSYQPGMADDETNPDIAKSKDVMQMPVWAIDGVPLGGMKLERMHTCTPFLNHVVDLLMKYANEFSTKDGKDILRDFYKNYTEHRTANLSKEWKLDVMPEDTLTVVTGNVYSLELKKKKWLEIKLDREEFINMRFTSPCLDSVTLIRDRKFIRRIEDRYRNEWSSWFEVSVFNAKPYEDIRILLETDGECELRIDTNPTWFKYMMRLRRAFVNDTHKGFVAIIIVGTFLTIIQDQSRYLRTQFQVEFLILIGLIILHQMFSNLGNSLAWFAVSACFPYLASIVSSGIYTIILQVVGGSVEFLAAGLVHPLMEAFLYITAFFTVAAANSGFHFFVFAVLAMKRPTDLGFTILALGPLATKSYYTPYYITLFRNGMWDIHFIVLCAGLFYLFVKGPVIETLRVIERGIIYPISFTAFFFQIVFASAPLEFHYACMVFLLLLNVFVRSHVPNELWSCATPDLDLVEQQYEKIDEEIEH